MRSATYYLDTAPSVNASTFNLKRGGRAKTGAYKAWIESSLWDLRSQKSKPADIPVSVSVDIPESSRLDIDNPLKATLDVLVRAKIIPNDNKHCVRSVSATFYDGKRMRVTVQSLRAED